MINIKDHKTLNMFDPLPYLGPRRRRLMESSWAKLFRDHVLFALPVDKIFKNYHWAMGRPNLVQTGQPMGLYSYTAQGMERTDPREAIGPIPPPGSAP